MRTSSAILAVGCFLVIGAQAQGFKFSNPTPEAQAEAAERAQRQAVTAIHLSEPCLNRIRNRKIMVLFAEEVNGMTMANQGRYSRQVEAVNMRLRAVGLNTYSPEEIRRQIAQEEIDAYFKNDPDRALSAARRLSAQYVLRGVIATSAVANPMVYVNQVSVKLDFTLTDSRGRPISVATASNQSYAGPDVAGMALTLIEERADEVVARLYSDYCRNADLR
jgi:hypothetical protein